MSDFQGFSPKLCSGYELIFERSIGGFMYLAFLPDGEKLLCISSQYESIIDLRTGEVEQQSVEYDEQELLAYLDGQDNCLPIAGQYGGSLPLTNSSGTRVTARVDHSGPYPICQLFWQIVGQRPIRIFKSYLPYIYGFSPDGCYYVHAGDGALRVLRRQEAYSIGRSSIFQEVKKMVRGFIFGERN